MHVRWKRKVESKLYSFQRIERARVYRGHKLIVYGIDISILEYLAGIYRRQGCNRKFDFRDPTKIETESFA